MSLQNQKKTKENQNCKPASRKVNKREHSVDYPKSDAEVPVKVHRLSTEKSVKDAKETDQTHSKEVNCKESR